MSTTRNPNYLEILAEGLLYDGAPPASANDTLDMASAERMYRTLRDVLNDYLETQSTTDARLRIADITTWSESIVIPCENCRSSSNRI